MDPIVICGYIYIYMDVYTQYVGVGKLPISVGDNSDLEYIFRCVFSFGFCRRRWFVGVWRGGFICVCTLQKRKVTMLHPQQPRPPTPSMSNESMVNPIFNVE